MLFRLTDVSLARGGAPVLRGVSAELPEGVSSLVGPSGSGKSTLLRLLNRLAEPGSGSIVYRDRDVRDYDVLELRREVCLVPQLPALAPGTVAENVGLGARLAAEQGRLDGRPPRPAPECLALAGLDPSFADRDAARLSVGERQRVMLARALALAPRVLLLDEPTSALDAEAREAVEATLRELAAALAISLVVVTHDLAQARRLARWAVRIEAGRVVAAGPTAEVLSR